MLRQLTKAPATAARMASRAAATPLRSSPAALSPLRFQAPARLPAASAAAAAQPRSVLLSAVRWYSSEPAKEEKPKEEKSKEDGASAAAAASAAQGEAAGEALSAADAAALRKELETKTKEASDFKDKYLRSVADFRNLQERTQREMKAARDYAITQFAKDLVDSVDNLDRALAMVPDKAEVDAAAAEGKEGGAADELSQDVANLVDGLRMTEKVLLQTLKKHGLERFDPIGDKFNPNEHEATFMTPVQDKEHNTVFHTQQTGFKLNGRILRAAKVGVVNNK